MFGSEYLGFGVEPSMSVEDSESQVGSRAGGWRTGDALRVERRRRRETSREERGFCRVREEKNAMLYETSKNNK